jgi:hypothetical protein
MPPTTVGENCEYFPNPTYRYLGYTFDAKVYPLQAAWPCPPSFAPGSDGGAAWFCTLEKGSQGVTGFPADAVAECAQAAQGILGFSWPL